MVRVHLGPSFLSEGLDGNGSLRIGVIVKFIAVDLVIVPVFGGVAQLGEHRPCKAGVKSSNLFISIYGTQSY